MSRISDLAGFTTAISTTEDLSVGIITASTFSGNLTGNVTGTASLASNLTGTPDITVTNISAGIATLTGAISATNGTFSGNVNIGGTLTYQDVEHIDSVGIITAQQGIQVLANGLDITGVATFKGNVSIADSIFHTGDTDTAIRFPSNNVLTVETAGGEAIRVDAGRRLLVGTDSSANYGGDTGIFQINGTTNASMALKRSTDNATEPTIVLAKSRGSADSPTVVNSNDILGGVRFAGYDGSDYVTQGASILCAVDGTPGSNDLPGRLVFNTTADGASTPSERVRINSSGNVGVGENSPQQRLHVSSTASTYIQVQNTGDSVNAYYGVDTASAWAGSSTNHPFKLHTNNAERVRVTGGGTAIFKAGLAEKFNNVGSTMASGTHAIQSGNIIRFTGNENGTNSLNITGIHSTLANGEALSFTVIISPNGSGIINAINIDGVAPATAIQWSGGSVPSAGASGRDVYTFTVLKIGTATNAYEIYGAATNYA